MHRLAALPGDGSPEEIELVEQPSAPVLFLTSATTDIATLATSLSLDEENHWRGFIRALPLFALKHPAQIDHYISTTAKDAQFIIIRLLGSRGHWSYGLDKFSSWSREKSRRRLVVVSGTNENELELHSIGNVDLKITQILSELLKAGGVDNMEKFLSLISCIVNKSKYKLEEYLPQYFDDPQKWDWLDEEGIKVCVILYRSLLQAGDITFAQELNKQLRSRGLVPRTIWISSLRNNIVQNNVSNIIKRESIKAVLISTSFSSVEINEASSGVPLWDELDIPILQLLTSSKTRQQWNESSIGLSPLDLSMQIVLTELEGRISTRPCAFKETGYLHKDLATVVQRLKPDMHGIKWVTKHVKNWIRLQELRAEEKRISIIIANYPVKNGRLANGVGLDTPASVVQILQWLKDTGHYLGDKDIPSDVNLLMKDILNSRTNDPESFQKEALDFIDLGHYLKWWNTLPESSRSRVTDRWGLPELAVDLESRGFPIHGVTYGNISLLIQPSRAYDPNNINDLHSPSLPPPHRYLAQYLWIKEVQMAHAVVNVGKHGSLEWLPGKAIGLSKDCFPQVAIEELPNIYPFIVNDPGEGSQAKRRSQAVIIDHLTPPLGIAGLHGDLHTLEMLLDEYYESKSLSNKRTTILEKKILTILEKNDWLNYKRSGKETHKKDNQELFIHADSYLCELKESQIRTGLHVFGKSPSREDLKTLCLLIIKAPNKERLGLTQMIANELQLDLNPWADDESLLVTNKDRSIVSKYTHQNLTRNSDINQWLDSQALFIIAYVIRSKDNRYDPKDVYNQICEPIKHFLHQNNASLSLRILTLWRNLNDCSKGEKSGFIKSICGRRVISGPSGAPTRGRPEVLPTGRNFYSVDLRSIPTEAAWDLGKRSANNILELNMLDTGEHLNKLALSVWGTSTMRNGGEDICQLLSLIGVMPVWDGPTRRVVDLEVIPLRILGRPRVDVVLRISGLFRDAFPHLIELVNQAQSLIASLNEPEDMNPLAATKRNNQSLGRIYGSAPGAYGAGLQALIDSGSWEDRNDLAKAYLAWSQWRYDEADTAIKDREGLEDSLKNVQVVIHNQDNREHDILDSDDYYQFQGGLASAIEHVAGYMPELYIGDNSRAERPKVHKLSKEIDKVVRSRLLNPLWIKGMKQHGYKGAFEMGASLDYLFAYDASTGKVSDWTYSQITDKWLGDVDTKVFLKNNNPWVLRDIAERLLEAVNRKLWSNATPIEIDFLKKIVEDSESCIENDEYQSTLN